MDTKINHRTANACGKGTVAGLILLAVGILIGLGVAKYAWPGFTPTPVRASSGTTELTGSAAPAAVAAGSDEGNPFNELREMQAEMNQTFDRSFEQIRANPKFKDFLDQPGYSLSLDVRNLKDRYQIRALLPDTKMSDAQVKLEGNQLKVDVSNKATEKQTVKSSQDTETEWGNYEEDVRLPGPLKDNQMKVERKEHELVITVPKA